jgi:hypothetical protein
VNPYPDGSAVLVLFPLTEEVVGDRENWSWIKGEIILQGGPDEWCILLTDARLGDEAGAVFRDSSEIRKAGYGSTPETEKGTQS